MSARPDTTELRRRVNAKRCAEGLTWKSVAAAIGRNPATVCRFMRGRESAYEVQSELLAWLEPDNEAFRLPPPIPAETLYLGKYQHGKQTAYGKGCRCSECRTANSQKQMELRKRRSQDGPPDGVRHGRSTYINWGCRCEVCTKENTAACAPAAKRWRAAHPEEANERSVRGYRKAQDASLESATRRGFTWTGPELELISREDLSVSEMALMLGRSYAAVATARVNLKSKEKPDSSIKHGSTSSYNKGCRCPECKAAKDRQRRASKQKRMERKGEADFKHGASGYTHWGCRCEKCRQAHADLNGEYGKRWKRRVQEETGDRASRRGQEWTGPEWELVGRDDLSLTEMARILGRSYAAVSLARHRLKADPQAIAVAGIAKGVKAGERP